jgi:hypothetical protein
MKTVFMENLPIDPTARGGPGREKPTFRATTVQKASGVSAKGVM